MAKAATRTCFQISLINGRRIPRPRLIWARTRREAEEKVAHGRKI